MTSVETAVAPVSVRRIKALCRKELSGYFATPLAYIFLSVFIMLSGFFTFELGSFFQKDQADLMSFFSFHPWLYLVLMPPLAMRLWAEERHSGSIELLMTLPLSTLDAVLAKFLAAWLFAGVALLLTTPMWLTVNYLGNPDNGIIVAGYLGSWLMGGAYLAMGGCLSALTKNQVIAFVITLAACLVFLFLGFEPVVAALPDGVRNLLASMSFLDRFRSISRGVLDVGDVGFFILFMVCWLWATVAVVNWKKAE
jgi:ABC-2 type transport system permease protein